MAFTFFEGFAIGLGLIFAIGAQAMFVLRQGLANEHLLSVCLLCSLSDIALITGGIAGFSHLSDIAWLTGILTYGGVGFLAWYGYDRIRSGITRPTVSALAVMQTLRAPCSTLTATIVTCLILTWLNPHVYVDTVFLIGGLANRYVATDRLAFGAGACMASIMFFFALGYGARLVASSFRRPRCWRTVDLVGGLLMWAIAFSLMIPST